MKQESSIKRFHMIASVCNDVVLSQCFFFFAEHCCEWA